MATLKTMVYAFELCYCDARAPDLLHHLEQGFDVHTYANAAGRTPLLESREESRVGEVLLFAAIEEGASTIVEILLAAGVRADVREVCLFEDHLNTPLHAISERGMSRRIGDRAAVARMAQALIVAGVDVEATNSEGHTALQCAIDTGFYSSPALITRLICEGAQVDERAARDALALQLTQSREYTTSFDRASWLYAPLLALFLAWRRSALPPLAAVLNLYGVPRDLLPHIVDSNIPLSPKLPSPLIEDRM